MRTRRQACGGDGGTHSVPLSMSRGAPSSSSSLSLSFTILHALLLKLNKKNSMLILKPSRSPGMADPTKITIESVYANGQIDCGYGVRTHEVTET